MTAAAKQKVYGNSDPALTYTYSGLATGDSFTGNLTRVSGENAGTYAINRGSLNVTNSDCYNFTYNGANLTISKRTVSIKADNKSKIYGDNDPALTFTVTSTYNLASGDKWEGALTRDSGQTVGTYAIKQGNLTVDKPHNYTINFTQRHLYHKSAKLNGVRRRQRKNIRKPRSRVDIFHNRRKLGLRETVYGQLNEDIGRKRRHIYH